jgi:hypothetical protein
VLNACAVYVGNGVKILVNEWRQDGDFTRFALAAVLPLLFCISLFFNLQIVQNVTMAIGPIAHYHQNSKYFSAVKPRPNKQVDMNLPHITIQMPVYKESLDTVLCVPSFHAFPSSAFCFRYFYVSARGLMSNADARQRKFQGAVHRVAQKGHADVRSSGRNFEHLH